MSQFTIESRSPTRLPGWVSLSFGAALFLAVAVGAQPTRSRTSLNDEVTALLRSRGLRGAVLVQEIRTGTIVASASTEPSLKDGVLPLSTTKLFLAALAWNHALPVDTDSLIVDGYDSVGRLLALRLRRELGSGPVLEELARFGFPGCTRNRTVNCFSLSARTSDTSWASTLSIGEANVRVTLAGLSAFLRAIGNGGGGLMTRAAAKKLSSALFDVTRRGTASGVQDHVRRGWRIGGKTGSGPGSLRPTNGVFAGLIADSAGRPRYTVVTWIARAGLGGGAAADVSADIANILAIRERGAAF